MSILRFLPNDQYLAAITANVPSIANPFATLADIGGTASVPILKQSTPPTDTNYLWDDTRRDEIFKYNTTHSKWLSTGAEETIIFRTPQAVARDGYFELAPGIIEYLVLEESYAMTITCDKGTLVDGTLGIETDIDGAIGNFSVTDAQNLEGGAVSVTPPGIISAGSVLKIKHLGLLDLTDTYIVLTLKKLAQ